MYGIPGLGFAKPGEKLPPLQPLILQPTEPAIIKSGGGLECAPEVKITAGKQEAEQAERHDDVIMAELAEEELVQPATLGGAAAAETSVLLAGPAHDAAATSITREAAGQDITMDDITQGIPPEKAARDARDADHITQDAGADRTPLPEPTPDSAAPDIASEEPRLGEGEPQGLVDVDGTLEARLEVMPREIDGPHVPRKDTTGAAAAAAEVPGNDDAPAAPDTTDAADAPEWEMDSSPYQSPEPSESDSSSDRGSDSSDDSDANAEEGGPASIAEMARRLIEMEDGSDDDFGDDPDSRRAAARALRTKNEMDETVPARPDVAIAPEAPLGDLGVIHHIVESTVVVSALGSAEHRALDVGSVVCTADRVVVGAIADLLGQVRQPFYTIRFSSAEEVAELGLEVGTALSYPVEHARYVFTEPLRRLKGSDASNVHDEEVADHEVEFSDDEKEREHRRAMREKKRGGGGGGGGGGGSHDGGNGGGSGPRRRGGRQGPHPLRNEVRPESMTATLQQGLPYDDGGDADADDGPYRPLKRPADYGMAAFVNAQQQQQARGPGFFSPLSSDSPQGRGRNRQRGGGGRNYRDGNHRGGSGQGRGNSSAGGGRGAGGYHHDRNGSRSTDYLAEQHQHQQQLPPPRQDQFQYGNQQPPRQDHFQYSNQQPPRQDQFQYGNQQQLQQPQPQVQPQIQAQPQPVPPAPYGTGFVAPSPQFNYSMPHPMPFPPISTPLPFGVPVPSAHSPAATPHPPLPAPSPAGFVNPMFFNSLMEQLRQQQGQLGPRPGQ